MIYVALHRGINVGGKGIVEMKRLKTAFERLGYTDVKTYINSGNVIFASNIADEGALTTQIETTLEHEFSFPIPVLIRSGEELSAVVQAIPKTWTNDDIMRCDVMFLKPEVDSPDILEKVPHNPEIEDLLHLPGAVVWRVDRANVRRGKVPTLIGSTLYRQMTIRNINTTRKVYELMRTINS